jgi:hypothetical protein
VWLIIARFCAQAAWVDDLRQLKHRYASRGLSLSLIGDWIQRFFAFQSWKIALASVERHVLGCSLPTAYGEPKRCPIPRLPGVACNALDTLFNASDESCSVCIAWLHLRAFREPVISASRASLLRSNDLDDVAVGRCLLDVLSRRLRD